MSICTPVITQLSDLHQTVHPDFGMYTVQLNPSNAPPKRHQVRLRSRYFENGQAQPSCKSTAKRAAAGLACQDHVNISLSSDCQRVITAREVLVSGSAGCIDRYYQRSLNRINNPDTGSHPDIRTRRTDVDPCSGRYPRWRAGVNARYTKTGRQIRPGHPLRE